MLASCAAYLIASCPHGVAVHTDEGAPPSIDVPTAVQVGTRLTYWYLECLTSEGGASRGLSFSYSSERTGILNAFVPEERSTGQFFSPKQYKISLPSVVSEEKCMRHARVSVQPSEQRARCSSFSLLVRAPRTSSHPARGSTSRTSELSHGESARIL